MRKPNGAIIPVVAGLCLSCATSPPPGGPASVAPPEIPEIPEEETAAVLGIRTAPAGAEPGEGRGETGDEAAILPRDGRVRGRIFYEGMAVEGEEGEPDVLDGTPTPGRQRGLPGAVVIVLAEPREGQLVGKSVQIVGEGPCRFRPRITVIQKGAPLLLTNAGRTAHDVSLETTSNPPFAETIAGGAAKEVVLDAPEAVACVCRTHRGRPGWIVAAGSPYYAVTDAAGNFRIGGIPPGEHPVRIWHETFVEQLGEVRVEPGGEVEFTYVMSQP